MFSDTQNLRVKNQCIATKVISEEYNLKKKENILKG
jgi:hypothetical protein